MKSPQSSAAEARFATGCAARFFFSRLKKKKHLLAVMALALFALGCNSSTNKPVEETPPAEVSRDSDSGSVVAIARDSSLADSTPQPETKTKASKPKPQAQEPPPALLSTRAVPILNWNGAVIPIEIVMPEAIYRSHPDTLKTIALGSYRQHEMFFPISIEDDFENGVSRERISYPEHMIFQFELFEKEGSKTPYEKRDVIVRHLRNGEFRAE